MCCSCLKYTDPYEFSLEEIDMKINATSHGFKVTWKAPGKSMDPRCYKSELQYKNQCVKNWMVCHHWTPLSYTNSECATDGDNIKCYNLAVMVQLGLQNLLCVPLCFHSQCKTRTKRSIL